MYENTFGIQFWLKGLHFDSSHIQFMLDSPQICIANWIATSMIFHYLRGFVHSPTKSQTASHALKIKIFETINSQCSILILETTYIFNEFCTTRYCTLGCFKLACNVPTFAQSHVTFATYVSFIPYFRLLVFGILVTLVAWFFFSVLPILPCKM